VGGAISLGLNHTKPSSRSVTGGTLLALTFVMLIGIPAALLLPTPRQINRGDGFKVDVFKQPSIWHEFALLKQIILRKDVLLLIPLFTYNQWYLSYQWNFNYSYFSFRGRALNIFLFYLFGTIGAWILGLFLDLQRVRTITRARSGFTVFSIIAGASWILGLVVEIQWKNTTRLYDWGDREFGLGCFLFCLWGFMDAMYNAFVYWVVGTLSKKLMNCLCWWYRKWYRFSRFCFGVCRFYQKSLRHCSMCDQYRAIFFLPHILLRCCLENQRRHQ